MCHDGCSHPVSGGDHLAESWITLLSGDESLPVFVVAPSQAPAPAIMIIHDINGPNDFYQDLARRLAAEGYLVALPNFFFRQGDVPEGDREAVRARGQQAVQSDAFRDMAVTLEWLKEHEDSIGTVGTVGMCWGGSMVMLQAARQPVPDASVAFYGFPVRARTETNPILAIDDDEVAAVSSPLLGFWGDGDAAVGMDNVAAYDDKLTAHDKPHEFTIYPSIGHGFLTFDPDAEAFQPSREAWARTLSFFDEHLKVTARG